MKVLFLGDVVGMAGRAVVMEYLPSLRRDENIDLVVCNGENSTHGFGIVPAMAEDLLRIGVDVITSGNHAFDRSDILDYYPLQPKLLRPLNFPTHVVGKGFYGGELANGKKYLVVNVMGQLFMGSYDDPFAALDLVVGQGTPAEQGYDAIVVDVHGEATSEKQAIGHYLDGRVSLVVGTHTHVPTADARVLEHGSGYQTDAGMCGCYDSVIGMEKTQVQKRFLRQYPIPRLIPATGAGTLCGTLVELDNIGLCRTIRPIRLGGALSPSQ